MGLQQRHSAGSDDMLPSGIYLMPCTRGAPVNKRQQRWGYLENTPPFHLLSKQHAPPSPRSVRAQQWRWEPWNIPLLSCHLHFCCKIPIALCEERQSRPLKRSSSQFQRRGFSTSAGIFAGTFDGGGWTIIARS